jgi:hypothetical protein
MNKDFSHFRYWVQEIWMQHKDECVDWNIKLNEADVSEYFKKYKYWLKREYKHRMREK